jgi:hypothetical protein
MERFYKGFSRLQWNDDKSQLAPDLHGKERYVLEWEHKAQQHGGTSAPVAADQFTYTLRVL